MLRRLLAFADAVDRLSEHIGQALKWLVLFSALISAGTALVRYGLHRGSNAWLEIQWYMFGAMFLLGSGYALKHGEHVRVDIAFSKMSPRTQAWVDVVGGVVFLLPTALIIAWMSLPMVANSIRINEYSSDPGGLLRWPIKIIIPIGFVLLALQGVADIIQKIAVALSERGPGKAYERPVQ
jgi:TRAP-type mannitol/chloroaromatic compound transport system permease small subunit